MLKDAGRILRAIFLTDNNLDGVLDCVGSGETRTADEVCRRWLELAGGVLRKMFLKENDIFERVEEGETRELEDACCRFFEGRGRILLRAFPKESDLDGMINSVDGGGTRVLEGGLNRKAASCRGGVY